MFIDEVELSLKNNTSFNDSTFTNKLTVFEDHWTKGHEHYASKPSGDCMLLSRMLLKKYAKEIEESK